jgi:hypothetical protein
VTAPGARVAGADVSAHAVIGAGRSLVHNGFATRWQPSATASTRTDANGAYTLTLREPGAYVVRVTAADHAPLEIGPFTYDTAAGRSGVDARLTQGGSIQGVVRVDAGRSPAGMIVGISRGDGHAVSQRVGPDGRFRFDRLMPGEWEVRRLDEDITAGASSSISTGGEFVAKWSCSVRDGEITHFDLGARRAAAVRLTAEVMVDGDGAAGWSLSLMEEVGSGHKPVASATVGYAGDAEIEAPGPGDYRILLTSPNSRLYVLRDMTLVGGDNRIDVTLRLGRVSVQGVAPPSADAPDVELSLVWFGDDGWFALMPLIAGENGVATVAEAPAGQMTVRRLNRGAPDPDPATWEIVRELTVPGDGSVDVSLDGE